MQMVTEYTPIVKRRINQRFVQPELDSCSSSQDSQLSTELNSKNTPSNAQFIHQKGIIPPQRIISGSGPSIQINKIKYRQSWQDSMKSYKEDDQKEQIQPSRTSFNQIPSSTKQQIPSEQYFESNFYSRHSFQIPTQPQRRKNIKQSSLVYNNNSLSFITQNRSQVNDNNQSIPSFNPSNGYYYSNTPLQENKAEAASPKFNQYQKFIQLNGTKNGFFKDSTKSNQAAQPYNIRQVLASNAVENILVQNVQQYQQQQQQQQQQKQQQSSISQLNHTNQQYGYGTRIKSLQNLSQAFKKIEELEINPNNNSVSFKRAGNNDSSLQIQIPKTESSRQIQFATKHSHQIPNTSISPVDLLKKQPSKGVLKNHSKVQFNSQSLLDQLDDDDDDTCTHKDNTLVLTNNSSYIVKFTPSSLDLIPEVQNKNENFTEITQPRIRRVIRNGQIIKKVMSDSFIPEFNQENTKVNEQNKETTPIKNITLQLKKYQSSQIYQDQTYKSDQQNDALFFNQQSPKKRFLKVQIKPSPN